MVAAAGREVDSVETAKRYIRSMFEARDHVAILAVPRRSPGAGVVQEVMPAEKLAAPATQERFGRLNRQGYDVYCTVNTMASDAKTRTKADVQNVRRLQLDLDHNGREGLQKLRRDVDAGQVPTPAIVMQSSRGRFQVLWHTEPNGWTPARAEETMRRLAARYGGDRAVADVARVMRMPGFRNCKDGREEWQVTWARYDSPRTQLRDFRSLPPVPTVTITPSIGTEPQDRQPDPEAAGQGRTMTFRGVRQNGRVLVTGDGTPLDWRASLALRPISPTGVEWGYSGSGPRQLAHALLLPSTDQATADRWCDRFYMEVTSRLPKNRWALDAGDILTWIEAAAGQRPAGRIEPDARPLWARRRDGDDPTEVRLRFRPAPHDEQAAGRERGSTLTSPATPTSTPQRGAP